MAHNFRFKDCGHNDQFVDQWGLIECWDCGAILIPRDLDGWLATSVNGY